jgi:hypothetical protein
MNKNFSACVWLIVAALGVTNAAKAQFALAKTRFPKGLEFYVKSIAKDESVPIYRNNISTRAVRNFMTNYESVSNERWFNAEDRFLVTFKLDDVYYRVDYDKRGDWIQTIRSYDQSKLPPGIRDMVNSSYRGYHLFLVQEVEIPLHPVNYFIHLDGEGRLINLRIFNSEIQELENFKKSG